MSLHIAADVQHPHRMIPNSTNLSKSGNKADSCTAPIKHNGNIAPNLPKLNFHREKFLLCPYFPSISVQDVFVCSFVIRVFKKLTWCTTILNHKSTGPVAYLHLLQSCHTQQELITITQPYIWSYCRKRPLIYGQEMSWMPEIILVLWRIGDGLIDCVRHCISLELKQRIWN